MSDTATAGVSRRQLLGAAGTAAALAAASLVGSVEAAQSTVERVPLTLTLTGPWPDGVLIPVEAPLGSERLRLSGSSSLLGQITYADRHDLYLDIDGYGLFANGEGALTGDSGDALFVRYTFLPRLTPTGTTEATGAFVVTGGEGKYGGSGGSGSLSILFDPAKQRTTFAFEGMLVVGK